MHNKVEKNSSYQSWTRQPNRRKRILRVGSKIRGPLVMEHSCREPDENLCRACACLIQRPLLSWCSLSPLALILFLIPFPQVSLSYEGRIQRGFLFRAVCSKDSLYVCICSHLLQKKTALIVAE